jgi:hypothetical protein
MISKLPASLSDPKLTVDIFECIVVSSFLSTGAAPESLARLDFAIVSESQSLESKQKAHQVWRCPDH